MAGRRFIGWAVDIPAVIAALASVAVGEPVLQAGGGIDDVTLGEGLAGGAISAFLTTLIVGAILVALAPAYVERLMAAVLDEPVGSLVYGFVVLVVLLFVTVLLVVTIVGILVAVPLILVAYLVWAVGATIAFLAIADRLVDREDGWLLPVFVAAALNGALAITGVGAILGLAVGAAGFGAVLRDYFG